MCGIFGTITEKGLEARRIDEIKDSLRHRGPDDDGAVKFDLGDGCALDMVHTRLSIIDLSKEAAQPMEYGNGALWIVYNGEVFNYKELKEELKSLGHVFNTSSDTEVVLASYKEWGEDCVKHFNGDWAFCIYDKVRGSIFLSRDRLGVKPLYYYFDGKNFAFSSEIKALFKMPFIEPEWNGDIVSVLGLEGVSDFSFLTMFKNVFQLEPATNMVFDLSAGRPSFSAYWEAPFNGENGRFDPVKAKKYAGDIRDMLEDAVRIRLRADVPVGTCLSGGIDSSTVAALISGLIKKHNPDAASAGNVQKTFTAEYPGENIDEGRWARLINDFTGAHGQFTAPKAEDLEADLGNFMAAHDELCRSTSMYAQYKVMELASRHVKVILDGQGADELFGGYLKYTGYKQRVLSSVPKKLIFLRNLRKKNILESIIKEKINDGLMIDVLKEKYPRRLNEILYADETRFNLQQLLRYEDRNSMYFGIEARVPFTDHRLVEYVLGIPACYKIHKGWTKYILRKAVEDLLPEEIVWRQDKIGFETPEKKWLSNIGEFKDFLSRFNINHYNGDYFWWRAFNFVKLNEMSGRQGE